jgi:hypothetical protein
MMGIIAVNCTATTAPIEAWKEARLMAVDYKAPFEPIESLDLFMRQAGEREKHQTMVSLKIGLPYRDDQNDTKWVCPFSCSWAANHSIPVFGVDSLDALATAKRAVQVMIEGYRTRLGRRFFYRNGKECGEEYRLPAPEKTSEQRQQDDKLFCEVHAFIQAAYWAGKSKGQAQQMIIDLKRKVEESER